MKGRTPWNAGLTAENDPRIARIAENKLNNVVDKSTLFELYVIQDLSLREIGERYGVSKHVIGRLVEEFGLERQAKLYEQLTAEKLSELYKAGYNFTEIASMFKCSPAYVNALARENGIEVRRYVNKAGVDPDPDLLRHLYWNEWQSYEAIAERMGVDFTTIPYWLRKFGIPRRTLWQTRRGKNWQSPDLEVVRHLYEAENLSLQSIGEMFDSSKSFIGEMLKGAGVPIRESGYPNVARYTAKDGHRVKSGLEVQVDDWLSDHGLPHVYEPPIGSTHYRADFLVRGVYIEIWGITGHERYEEKRRAKLDTYSQLGLCLLSLYPNDFPHLDALDALAKNVP